MPEQGGPDVKTQDRDWNPGLSAHWLYLGCDSHPKRRGAQM